MLASTTIDQLPRGTLSNLLTQSYAAFHAEYPEYLADNLKSFAACDDFFYDNMLIGLSCCVLSLYDGSPVGMICWDPRAHPHAVIGHNCIVPAWQGKGLGKAQLGQALDMLQRKGFTSCAVSTGLMDFFAPARRMYEACGFRELRRDPTNDCTALRMHDMIYYRLSLWPS